MLNKILKPKSEKEIFNDMRNMSSIDRFCNEFKFYFDKFGGGHNHIDSILQDINSNNLNYSINQTSFLKTDIIINIEDNNSNRNNIYFKSIFIKDNAVSFTSTFRKFKA